MKTRKIGALTVSEVGMGCMAFSHGYGQIPPETYKIGRASCRERVCLYV